MLETIVVVLVVLWVLGYSFAITTSGAIHGLLVLALVLIVIRLIQGRKL